MQSEVMKMVKGIENWPKVWQDAFWKTYHKHIAAMGEEMRRDYTVKKIKEVKYDKENKTMNVYYKNGMWWHYTVNGTWY